MRGKAGLDGQTGPPANDTIRGALERDGWCFAHDLLGGGLLTGIQNELSALEVEGPVRDALSLTPLVHQVAEGEAALRLVEAILGAKPFPVRAALFCKSRVVNWPVAWHQDKTIAVREHQEIEGFGPWSSKAGVPHVEPPVEVLKGMVTLRVLLDDCAEESGPLRVIPGTHTEKLNQDQIAEVVRGGTIVELTGNAGDAILMRPLLVHGSRRSTAPTPRRVLHLEYAAAPLPSSLRWTALRR